MFCFPGSGNPYTFCILISWIKSITILLKSFEQHKLMIWSRSKPRLDWIGCILNHPFSRFDPIPISEIQTDYVWTTGPWAQFFKSNPVGFRITDWIKSWKWVFQKQKRDSELRSEHVIRSYIWSGSNLPFGFFRTLNSVWDLFDPKKQDYPDPIRRVDSVVIFRTK